MINTTTNNFFLLIEGKRIRVEKKDGEGKWIPAANLIKKFPEAAKNFVLWGAIRMMDENGKNFSKKEMLEIVEICEREKQQSAKV